MSTHLSRVSVLGSDPRPAIATATVSTLAAAVLGLAASVAGAATPATSTAGASTATAPGTSAASSTSSTSGASGASSSRKSGTTVSSVLSSLTEKDASAGLRTALSQGIDKAVGKLGVPNGFTSDARFTIPLPAPLAKGEKLMRTFGMQKDADALKSAMNRAAELAVAEAKPVFRKALTGMTLADAKSIVSGGETAGTDYFRKATSEELATRFKPIVAKATEQVKLGATYDKFAGKASQLGLVKPEDANLNDYVTRKALDSLFLAVADEERAIRKDPLGQTSSLLKKVFGGK